MNLHEYQAKNLLKNYGLPVPKNGVANNLDDAIRIATELGEKCVVKAQIHAGGRGKSGGVKVVSSRTELTQMVQNLLGKNLVTYQTDQHGQPVNQVLIEEPCAIARELYLSALIDRKERRLMIMASTEGGMDIEKVAEETPEKILKIIVDPMVGVLPYQAREVGFQLKLTLPQIKQFDQILRGIYQLFVDKDLSLIEINPLVVKQDGDLICLDAKITLDDNAMYRHADLREMRDSSQEDERENRAKDWELNYVALEGDIGCMVNGAGLAMATMDLIKLHGGNPANFLDVGGGATKERVTEAFKIILSDQNVKGVLVNIFGGIVRCDLIADGIIGAIKEVGISIPVVVRLEGNQAELASKILKESGLNIIAAPSLTEAAQLIVQSVKK